MGSNEFWTLFMILMFGGWIITTWIRAKHGYPVENSWGGMTEHPQHTQKSKEDAEADRQKILALEQRIRVLEKIITENHKAYSLSEEIDQLQEQVNER